jgi:hypothetical protein
MNMTRVVRHCSAESPARLFLARADGVAKLAKAIRGVHTDPGTRKKIWRLKVIFSARYARVNHAVVHTAAANNLECHESDC